ncbi:MAG: CBS domain-containing protein [Elusimicrobia bacterium]|nr:CBS domain-containing protein [Elusimicrobiota bacterium]
MPEPRRPAFRVLAAKDVMSRDVVTARPEEPLLKLARLLQGRRISGIPIVGREGHLIGVVSQSDLVRHALGGEGGATAAGVMTPWAVSCEEDTPLEEVARQMVRKRIHRVLVTRGSTLVGIVSAMDVLQAWLGEREARAVRPPAPRRSSENLLSILERGHARLRSLAARVDEWARSPAGRPHDELGAQALAQLVSELERHEELEMLLLFPAIRDHAPGAEALLGSMAVDHGLVDHAVAPFKPGGAAWSGPLRPFAGKAVGLASRLRRHLAEEERQIFPLACHYVPPSVLKRLGAEAGSRPRAGARPTSRRRTGRRGRAPTRGSR